MSKQTKADYKPGDVVVPHIPEVKRSNTYWNSWVPDMDEYAEHPHMIEDVIYQFGDGQYAYKIGGYWFYSFWFTAYNEPNIFINENDLTTLLET